MAFLGCNGIETSDSLMGSLLNLIFKILGRQMNRFTIIEEKGSVFG